MRTLPSRLGAEGSFVGEPVLPLHKSPGCSSRNGGLTLFASSSFSIRGAMVRQLDGRRTGINPTE